MNRIPYYASLLTVGGASFFTLPVRIIDQEYHAIGDGAATDIDFRFLTTGSVPAMKLQRRELDNSLVLVPDQDQWKTNTSTLPAMSIRRVGSIEGDGTPSGGFPAEDIWEGIGNPSVFGMVRPAFGTSRFIIFRIEMAETSDLTTILASALLTLRWTRQ